MKKSTNRLMIILMSSSIALLLILQGLWLTSSYERAYYDLRRETNGLFRLTVQALRDSMISKQLVQVTADSVKGNVVFKQRLDGLPDLSGPPPKNAQISIFISGDRRNIDSIDIIKPLASGIREGRMKGGRNFVLRVNADTLSLDTIRLHYKNALATIDIRSPFTIKTSSLISANGGATGNRLFRRVDMDRHVETNPFSKTLSSDWVTLDPMHRYAFTLESFRPILLKKILPQILFSLFLTIITIAAFIFLMKGLRSQQRLITMKNDFISNITHELKTPIATVSVALEALKNFNGIENPTRTREYLDIAQHELERLSMLTDKVLNTSLFDERGVKLDIEEFNIENVIEDILNSTTLIASKNNASIEFNKTGSNFMIQGSVVHLTNVIHNLIDNAIKYSPEQPSIQISLTDSGNSLSISITDNGLGIPEEYHDKIFEKFFRMPTGDVHNIKGYGLGLSYVDSVVKSHRGKITVSSESGKGSTFTIVLPRTQNV